MANFIENLGLEFLTEDEDSTRAFAGLIATEGKGITGYYGAPYLNKHFGDAQFIMRTWQSEEENRLEMTGIDTHCAGSCVWNVRVSGVNLDPDDAEKTQKRIVATKPYTNGGLAPINIVNADVLPSYMKDEIIKLQMIAFPVAFDYFADEAAYEDSVTDEYQGGKLLLAEGHIFPSGMLKNRNPNSEDFEKNNWMDDHVLIRGKVKKIGVGKAVFEKDSFDAYIACIIDTEYGELEIIHSFDQVKEEQRENLRVGATISGVFVLSGDPAIYEYDKGIVLDAENDLRLLRGIFAGGDPERLRRALADDAVYIAEYNDQTYAGADEIINRLKFVQEDSDEFFAYFATISSIDEGEGSLAYDVGARCIVIARGEKDNYITIAFVEVNDEGKISCIRTSDNARYHFRVDEAWHPTEEEEDENEESFDVRPLPELLVEEHNYATCELYVDDYNAIKKSDWEEVENTEEKSNGFFHEDYYDTENHDIETAGMCLSVTELFDGRRLLSLKVADGTRHSVVVEEKLEAKDIIGALNDEMLALLPDACKTGDLRLQGRTAIKHYIRQWLGLNVYLVLSFEIVYGSHQASLTAIGDTGAFCENILNSALWQFKAKAKTQLERCERFRKKRDMSRAERATAQADIRYNHLMALANGYQTGCFDELRPLLAEDCVWESQWRIGAEKGRDAVMEYYEKKGTSIRNSGSFPVCSVVELVGNSKPSAPVYTEENGERKPAPTVALLYTEGKLCLYMEQVVDGQKNGAILDLTLDTDGLISRIDVCIPDLFRFVPYQKENSH